jgi:hypothetical protein
MGTQHQASGVSFAKKALRQHILKAALNSSEFRASLAEAASEIKESAKPLATEATVEGAFERNQLNRSNPLEFRICVATRSTRQDGISNVLVPRLGLPGGSLWWW